MSTLDAILCSISNSYELDRFVAVKWIGIFEFVALLSLIALQKNLSAENSQLTLNKQ